MRKKLRQFTQEYLTFSASNRRAIWVIVCLIFLILLAPFVYKYFIHKSFVDNYSDSLPNLDSLFEENDKKDSSLLISFIIPDTMFDPNSVSNQEWIKMGISVKTANAIEKYKAKGGKFHSSEDLLRMYHFDTAIFKKIEHLLKFSKPIKPSSQKIKTTVKSITRAEQIVELNSADTAELEKLPGIGKVLSARIIKYRNLLGGFVNAEQLLEVYGLSPETLKRIKSKITIEHTRISTININTCTFEQLSKHPYIKKNKAALIIKYRNFIKKISNCKEFIINGIFTSEELEKVEPYFNF